MQRGKPQTLGLPPASHKTLPPYRLGSEALPPAPLPFSPFPPTHPFPIPSPVSHSPLVHPCSVFSVATVLWDKLPCSRCEKQVYRMWKRKHWFFTHFSILFPPSRPFLMLFSPPRHISLHYPAGPHLRPHGTRSGPGMPSGPGHVFSMRLSFHVSTVT